MYVCRNANTDFVLQQNQLNESNYTNIKPTQKKPRMAEKQPPKPCWKTSIKSQAMEECLQSLLNELANPVAEMLGEDHFSAYQSFLCAIEKLY